MKMKNSLLLCFFLISCNTNSNSKQENPKKSKAKSNDVVKEVKKPPPISKKKPKPALKVEKVKAPFKPFDKDGILINKKSIWFKKWGIKVKYHKEFTESLKKHTKPVLVKKSKYIKYSEERYSFNFKYSYASNLFIELRKINKPAPKKLKKFETSYGNSAKSGLKGLLKYSVGVTRVRGPGNCSRGRCMHRLVNQLNGLSIFPITKRSHLFCKVSVTEESDVDSKKFNKYFDICMSISKIVK